MSVRWSYDRSCYGVCTCSWGGILIYLQFHSFDKGRTTITWEPLLILCRLAVLLDRNNNYILIGYGGFDYSFHPTKTDGMKAIQALCIWFVLVSVVRTAPQLYSLLRFLVTVR